MVPRVFAEGCKDFEGGNKDKTICSDHQVSNRTASRDLSDLVARGIIIPLPGNGRTNRYELTVVESVGFGLEKK